MNPSIQFKTTIPNNLIRQLSLVRAFLFIALALGGFALSPAAQAVLPAPDGGYPGANTAEGDNALFSLTSGFGNTANGADALFGNSSGSRNTAVGTEALFSNSAGGDNTATGVSALHNNTTGNNNTAVGNGALYSNTTGFDNTAVGHQALLINTTGSENTANGDDALRDNTTGIDNTATGERALEFNTTGQHNTALGVDAGEFIIAGNYNILLGARAGFNLTTGDNNIDIGNQGVAAEANTIRIGTVGTQTNAYVAGIYNTTVAKGVGVVVDSTGHLGTKGSSERFKDAIKPMERSSEAILALKPVTFRYKKEFDPDGIPQFGLVAEEVEKVNPALVARDDQGKVYTVRYEAVNAMLLNEFLKEYHRVQELKSIVAKQEAIIAQEHKDFVATTAQQKQFDSKIAHQQNEIEALTAGLQKVNAQVEANKPSPQIVVSDQ